MLFESIKLHEADPSDVRPTPVSRKPSEVTYDNLPTDVKTLAAAGKWTEAYSKLVNSKDIDVFLDKFIDEYSGFSSFADRIAVIKAPLKRELMSLGNKAFQPETNPILKFLPTYFSKSSNHKFTEEQFKALLSLWSEGIIDDKDLKATEIEKCILLNRYLYDKTNMPFIVQAYYWLSNKKNVSAYLDLDTPDAKTLETKLNRIYGDFVRDVKGRFWKKNVNAFRDLIIFKDMLDPTGEINDATEIQARLQRLQDTSPSEEEPDDSFKIRPERFTEDEIKTILTAGPGKFTKEAFNKIVNYAKSKGWI